MADITTNSSNITKKEISVNEEQAKINEIETENDGTRVLSNLSSEVAKENTFESLENSLTKSDNPRKRKKFEEARKIRDEFLLNPKIDFYLVKPFCQCKDINARRKFLKTERKKLI